MPGIRNAFARAVAGSAALVLMIPHSSAAASGEDRAVTVAGDATGLHVLVADEASHYAWRTAATLSEPGAETDQWIGQQCVTASGRRAVVVYAPRQITNEATLFSQGARAAVVDLNSGHVTKLPETVSIAYHNPGCGTGEEAVLSRYADGRTTLFTVDAARGAITDQVSVAGQATSAVRYGDGIAVAKGNSVIAVDAKGATRVLATAAGSPFRLVPDGTGGLAYQVPTGDSVQVRRYSSGSGEDTLLGTGALGAVELHSSGGRVFVTGPDAAKVTTPSGWRFPVRTRTAPAQDPSTVTIDPDRGCALPRNDPHLQSLQPTPSMVEWAVDRAVRGELTVTRRPGWNGSDLPAYQPQSLFPPHELTGGGQVPAQIVLGVLAQESNLQQASRLAVPGENGNFTTGGFYGLTGDYRQIDWSKVDCGYGIAQVTDGMKRGDTKYSQTQQTALTVDYAANIAAGLQLLQDKWNQLAAAGVTANDGDPRYLENWFFALWAYNSGYHAKGADPSGQYGLGWANNPANPNFLPGRKMFMTNAADAGTPNKWSYPERVMGWAAHSQQKTDPITGDTKPAFPIGKWSGDPQSSQPPLTQFCTPDGNQCDSAGACQRDDLRCWWHTPSTWVGDCSASCGTEVRTYHADDPEPPVTTAFQIPCATPPDMPAGTIVVDDVDNDVAYGLGDDRPCRDSKNWVSRGTLSFSFGSAVQNGVTVHPAKVDFHQLSSGFGGHFWLAYLYGDSDPDMRVTGTWTPDLGLPGTYRIKVYVPSHRTTGKVTYVVRPGTDDNGVAHDPVEVAVDQNLAGGWTLLSDLRLYRGAAVELSNLGSGADGSAGFGFDAMAFSPLT